MANLNPITRKEAILNGDDITPVTREEYFAKKAVSGGGGGIPTPTAEDNGKVLTAGADGTASWQTAGGGGAFEPFKIRMEWGSDSYELSGITFSDLKAAYEAGRFLFFSFGNAFEWQGIPPLYHEEGGTESFYGTFYEAGTGEGNAIDVMQYEVVISNDGTDTVVDVSISGVFTATALNI